MTKSGDQEKARGQKREKKTEGGRRTFWLRVGELPIGDFSMRTFHGGLGCWDWGCRKLSLRSLIALFLFLSDSMVSALKHVGAPRIFFFLEVFFGPCPMVGADPNLGHPE